MDDVPWSDIEEYAYLFVETIAAESDYFTMPGGECALDHNGPNLPYRDIYSVKRDKLIDPNNLVNRWFFELSSFRKAEQLFTRKNIKSYPFDASMPHYYLPHGGKEGFDLSQFIGPPPKSLFERSARVPVPGADNTITPLSLNLILKGITTMSLVLYWDVEAGALGSFVKPKGKIENIQKLARDLRVEIASDPFLVDCVDSYFLNLLRGLEEGYPFSKRGGVNIIYATKTRHGKANREIFIKRISALYGAAFGGQSEFESGGDFGGVGSSAIVFSRKYDGEDLSVDGRDLNRIEMSNFTVHSDVIADITAIIDSEITKRKVRDILGRYKEAGVERQSRWGMRVSGGSDPCWFHNDKRRFHSLYVV